MSEESEMVLELNNVMACWMIIGGSTFALGTFAPHCALLSFFRCPKLSFVAIYALFKMLSQSFQRKSPVFVKLSTEDILILLS